MNPQVLLAAAALADLGCWLAACRLRGKAPHRSRRLRLGLAGAMLLGRRSSSPRSRPSSAAAAADPEDAEAAALAVTPGARMRALEREQMEMGTP